MMPHVERIGDEGKHFLLRFFKHRTGLHRLDGGAVEEREMHGFSLDMVEEIAMKFIREKENGFTECIIMELKSIITM